MFLCLITSLVSLISHFLGQSVPECYCSQIFLLFYEPSCIEPQGSFLLNLTSLVFIRFLASLFLNSLILDVNVMISLFSLKYFLSSFFLLIFLFLAGILDWRILICLFHFWQRRPTFSFWSFILFLSLAIIITCSESYLDLFLFEIWGICMSLISSDVPSGFVYIIYVYQICFLHWSSFLAVYPSGQILMEHTTL